MRKSLDKHTRALVKFSEPFGTADLEALERLNEKAVRLDGQIAEQNIQIDAILANETLEDLEHQLTSAQAAVRGIQQQKPKWQKKVPDLESLKKDAEAIRDKFVTEVETAEKHRDAAQVALATANEKKTDTAARFDETVKRIQSLRNSLNELSEDGKTDTQRAKEIAKIALRWDAARSALEEVEGKLNTFEHDPRIDLEKLEGLRKSAEEEVKKALGDEKREEGRLEQLSAQGTYSLLVKIEEEVGALTEEVNREQIRADAVRLLYDTVEQCRSKAMAEVGRPVEQAATRTFQRIAGGRLGSIKVGEYFEPASILPQRTEESVSVSSVSGGEKEQIYLATRLALAELLASEERQLVVLDDVLTATDSLRMGRVLRVLEEASEKLQIVILTCHPERYGAFTGAKFIDIEEALRV
jgi:chromosome segregation ATPase